ncbi:MAG: sigma-70 family RNA polymerase sigma factor [Bacteroidota bacterium]
MQESSEDFGKLMNHLFRVESGKMIAVLSRLFGLQKVDIAQDIVQDTLLAALQIWPFKGLPENPSAWLMQTAKNRAIDYLRRQKRKEEYAPEYAYLLQSEYTLGYTVQNIFLDHEIENSQLRMIFACCHPSIQQESQIALILKTLCGLGVGEIAKAFLTNSETIAKRIFRAKEKIRLEKINLEVPTGKALSLRLNSALKVLYLLFNEGYYSANPDFLIREELCEDAMRLCFLLVQNSITSTAETKALMALMCLQSARFNARTNSSGQIVLLKNQDRSLWHKGLITQGYAFLEQASEQAFRSDEHTKYSIYHLEAAIAGLHASSESFEKTNWNKIHELYEALYHLQPNNIVAMNKAVALAYGQQPDLAILELLKIQGLDKNPIYHTILGEVYSSLKKLEMAKIHFQKALKLDISELEKFVINEKLNYCQDEINSDNP